MSKWLEENRRYNNFIRNRYSSLYEADRTRFISKNPNLSEEQKQEVIDTFKKYPAIDKDIKWGSNEVNNWTYEQFKPYLNRAGKSVTQSKKQKTGILGSGLELGKDYLILEQNDKAIAYQPLTYYASRIIASNDTPPKVVEIDTNNKYMTGAKWCISWQKSRRFWDYHSIDSKEVFVIICGEEIPTKKVCLTVSKDNYDSDGTEYNYSLGELNYNIWDFYDDRNFVEPRELEPFINLKKIIKESYRNYQLVLDNHQRDVKKSKEINKQKILNHLILNPTTNRYDYSQTDDFEIEVTDLIEDGKFMIPLGFWKGHFNCKESSELISLENAPQEVTGNFYCSGCANLKSLVGAPRKVGMDFLCSECKSLTTLEGISEEVGGNIICRSCDNLVSLGNLPVAITGDLALDDCIKLESLEGCPEIVRNISITHCHNLKNLNGSPKEVVGSYWCSQCYGLLSLEGISSNIKDDLYCNGCYNLISLKGCPEEILGSLSCEDCEKLESLEGAPKIIGETFMCCGCNKLQSLEGAPHYVGRHFSCRNCHNLKSLEGAPKKVGESFSCEGPNLLETLEGGPKEIGKSYLCSNCNKLISLEGAPKKVPYSFKCISCKNLISLKGAPEDIGENFDCGGCSNLTSLEGAPTRVGGIFYANQCCLSTIENFNTKVGRGISLYGNPGYPFERTN